MRKLGIVLVALLVAMACPARPRVGLVLSGGGAKGVAHIGVIQAFEDNDIPIDYITGTSMGAIVGSLYASGYSPAEMMQLLASPGFADWSTGKINPDDTYFFLTRNENPSFIRINLGKDSTAVRSILPMSLINPIPMNMAFLDIYSRFTAQCGGDFDRLFVPFRCVTSDVYAKHKVVLGKGSLADAVRMSMSFPMVFEPIELDGVPMYDGGIYDNFPVDVMMDVFKPDALVGIDVGSKQAAPDTRNPMAQMEEMIMQPNDYPFPYDKGVRIRIDLDEFSLLDFGKAAEIYEIGYRRALESIDSVKAMTGATAPKAEVEARRARFKAATPRMRIDSVTVHGGTPTENAYIEKIFHPSGKVTATYDEARTAYYRAISSGQLQNLVPTPIYNKADSSFTLSYRAVVKEKFGVGVGGYISSSTNSMLFFHLGYDQLRFKSLNADVNAWVGQSYMAAEGTFKAFYNTRRPTALELRAVVSRQKFHETEKLFYQVNAPDFIRRSEAFGRAAFTWGPTRRTRMEAGVGLGHLTDKYHSHLTSGATASDKDCGIFNLGQVRLVWEYNSINSPLDPTEGVDIETILSGVAGKYHYRGGEDDDSDYSRNQKWLQARVSVVRYWSVNQKFSMGMRGLVLASTRKLLPTYEASIVAAEGLHPTPSSYNHFSPALRANSYVALGALPVYKVSSTFSLRGSLVGFVPFRRIEAASDGGARYGRWLHDPQFFGELEGRLSLGFASISAYGNYATGGPGWNFGISIGTFILAPGFLR